MENCNEPFAQSQCQPPTEVCTVYQCWQTDPNVCNNNEPPQQQQPCRPSPSTENYKPPSLIQQGATAPSASSFSNNSSRAKKLRDDTPKTINMGFLHLSKPVFNKQNRSQSRTQNAQSRANFRTKSKGPKPISLGRRGRKPSRSKSKKVFKSRIPKPTKSGTSKARRAGTSKVRKGASPGGATSGRPSRAKGRSKGGSKRGAKSGANGSSSKRGGSKGRSKSKGSKKPGGRGKSSGKTGSRGRSKSKKKGKSKSGSKKSKSKSSSGSKGRKKQRGRSKQKSARKKPRGPPPTPVSISERKTQSLLVSRLEKLNMYRFLNAPENPSRVDELRGYNSEPEITVPFEAKFELRKPAPKIPIKCKSMEDVLVSCNEHHELLTNTCQAEDILGAELENISPSCWKKWRDLFQTEKDRYSFYDELYNKKYITDSMEIPSVSDDVSYLIEADNEHFRSKIDYGRIVLKSKHVYTGNFQDWYFHGPGRYVWLDGKIYQGDFALGVMDGEGTFVWPDGSIYEGEFRGGMRRGRGLYSTPQGYIYSGDWNDGVPHGRGKIWYDTDGNDYYEGEIENGKIQGVGTRQYKNGDRYVGRWYRGKQDGHGTMLWRSLNQIYRGQWHHGKPNSKGIQVWYRLRGEDEEEQLSKTKNWRNIFKGHWNRGLRHGKGKLFFPNGSVYEGVWEDGKQVVGQGKYVDPTGELLMELACIQGDEAGFMEEILDRHVYECLFNKLIDTLSQRFALKKEECGVTEAQNLAEVCFRYMPELKLLYKRAGVLGTIWSGSSNFPKPAAGNNGCRNCMNDIPFFNLQGGESTNSSMYAKLNNKMAPDKFPVTRFGLWLLVGDCENSLRHVSTAYYDTKWRSAPSVCFQEAFCPFETVHFWQFVQCLVMVAFEMAIGIPFDRSRIKYKCTKEKAESPLNTGTEEKIINCKENPDEKRKSSAKGRKKSLRKNSPKSKKGTTKGGKRKKNSEGTNKSSIAQPSEASNSITKEVEDALKVNPSDDDFIDIAPADDGALARPPSALIEQDAHAQTETDEVLGEKESSEEDIFESDDKMKCEVISLAEIFDKFMADCIIKVFDRLPGKLLPRLPNPPPSMFSLYEEYYTIKNAPIITGADFLRSMLSADVHPASDIFWVRSKDVLAANMDYKHLLHYAQKLSLITPSRLLLEPVEISDSESEMDFSKPRSRSRSRPKMLTREFAYSAGSIQPITSEQLAQTSQLSQASKEMQALKSLEKSQAVQDLQSQKSRLASGGASKAHQSEAGLAQLSQDSRLAQDLAPMSVMALASPHKSAAVSAEASVEYCLPTETEEETEAIVAEEPKKMGIFEEENIFDVEQELLLPDGKSFEEQSSSKETEEQQQVRRRTNLTSEDVINVLRKLYPELCGAEDPPNITFEMTFCDWLWALTLCAQVSSEKSAAEFERPLRPSTMRRLPLSSGYAVTPPNTSVFQCEFCHERGDTAKTFQEVILPAFMRHEELRLGDVAITKTHGTRGFQPIENRHLQSRAGHTPSSATSSRKSVAI